jgi:hypothetical protein
MESSAPSSFDRTPSPFDALRPPPGEAGPRKPLTRRVALLLGAASLVPAVSAVIFFPGWLATGHVARLPVPIVLGLLLCWIGFAATAAFFMVRVLTQHNVDRIHRLFWFMALQGAAPISAPIYWWLHVWREIQP